MSILQKNNSIPFYLITGFLGSGKTTLLANILKEYSATKRIAVIQNEFAPSGTDGKNLKLTGNSFHLEEINNGSVFCICLMANFLETLHKVVKQHHPDMIFLEASGLSDPVNILALLQDQRVKGSLFPAGIFCVADAQNFRKGFDAFPGFRHQIMMADTVIINKTDLINTTSGNPVSKKIKELNPFAHIVETSWCKVDLESITTLKDPAKRPAAVFSQKESSPRPSVAVSVLRSHTKISPNGLQQFLKALSSLAFRAKGHVNLTNSRVMAIQLVFGTISTDYVNSYTGPTEIIAFAEELSPAKLKTLFTDHTAL